MDSLSSLKLALKSLKFRLHFPYGNREEVFFSSVLELYH